MAVRKLRFAVTADGISPAVKCPAGVQGEHKATELIFNLDTELYRELQSVYSENKKPIYRIDGYDGEGGVIRYASEELTNPSISFFLEERLTRAGGVVKVILVLSVFDDETTEMELYSFPAILQFKNLPSGKEMPGGNHESISTLAEIAKKASESAVRSSETAVDAMEKTVQAKAVLENGTVWVFDGGDVEGKYDLDGDGAPETDKAEVFFVIDNEMSDKSKNAVQNKVAKAYVDKLFKEVMLQLYPVGSVHFSENPDDPNIFFGGSWELRESDFAIGDYRYYVWCRLS